MRCLRRISSALVLVALLIAPVGAIYNAASIIVKETLDDGRLHVVVQYTGNAGEVSQNVDFILDGTITDPEQLRGLVISKLNQLNGRLTLNGLIALGAVNLTPIVPSVVGIPSYTIAPLPFTPGATPQDVCTLTGSATKTVLVTGAILTSTQTTAGLNVWSLLKRSTANTGGTSVTAPGIPVDSASAAATAVARAYTANPTAGTLVGRYSVLHVDAPAPGTAGIGSSVGRVKFDTVGAVVLRGVNEVLAWNFNGAALPTGLSVSCSFDWSEQ